MVVKFSNYTSDLPLESFLCTEILCLYPILSSYLVSFGYKIFSFVLEGSPDTFTTINWWL